MRGHLENALYGVADYAAFPLGMLAVAPVLLHKLGAAQFGIWAFAMALANTGAIIASGFGDANIQQIAAARSTNNFTRIESCVRATLGVHIVIGATLGLAGYLAAPWMALHITGDQPSLVGCIVSLRIASIVVFVRALETVVVSTQRAFERYSEAVRISAGVRVLSLTAAAGLAAGGFSVEQIVGCTALLLIGGTLVQFVRLSRFVSRRCLVPGFERTATRELVRIGIFTWAQATAGVIFGQADRLFVGLTFGAVAVGAYSLCMQVAQPIAGSAASALHFIFPYIARRSAGEQVQTLQRPLMRTFICNLVLVLGESIALLAFGEWFLRRWAGPAVISHSTHLLPLAVLGAACAGLAVTGTYAMLALAQARPVVWVTAASGIAMLSSMAWLQGRYGIIGVATSRIVFGLTSLAIYLPLLRYFRRNSVASSVASTLQLTNVQEGV